MSPKNLCDACKPRPKARLLLVGFSLHVPLIPTNSGNPQEGTVNVAPVARAKRLIQAPSNELARLVPFSYSER